MTLKEAKVSTLPPLAPATPGDRATLKWDKANVILPQARSRVCGETLPYDYISDDYQRINFYRRIAECYSDEQLEQIKQDTIDRFGKLPKPVSRLFAITALKLLAGKYGIDSISYINGELHIYCKGIVYRTANYKLPRPSGKNPDALLTSIKNLVKCAGQAIGKP